MYEYYNNTIAIQARWLYKDAGIISEYNYKALLRRGWLKLLRRACRNTPALVEFHSMRPDIKEKVIRIAGDPKKHLTRNILQDLIKPDHEAIKFFSSHRKPNGKPLSSEKKKIYATNAMILNAIKVMITDHLTKARAMGQTKTKMWQNVAKAVNALEGFDHTVPGSYRRVRSMYEKYQQGSYQSLLHGGEGNANSAKIVGDVADWFIAHYSLPNKPFLPILMSKYNDIREDNNWPELSEQAVHLFLHKKENERLWYLGRHGKQAYTKKFGYTVKRDRSNWFPDAYWGIDGTKLDWIHYWDETRGEAAKLRINPVFDIYSEKIIGWSYSLTEDHTDHFKALKMATANSGHRPYLLTYDNQSGHKSHRMQELYSNLVAKEKGLHYPHQAYRSSNPVEGIFSRFQQQVLNQFWFSDKQSIKAKSLDSHHNPEFIKKFRHELKTLEQLLDWWKFAVNKWNNAKHPKFDESRSEVYQHERLMNEELDITEMINIFWIEETMPITYTKNGLRMRLKGDEYWFEVFDDKKDIDLEFRRKHVGEKFIVRYDPELMNEGVQLWQNTNEGKVYMSVAGAKRGHENIPALMKEGDKERWWKDFQTSEEEYTRDLAALEAIRMKTGITEESLIEDQEYEMKNYETLPKEKRNQLESNENLAYSKL